MDSKNISDLSYSSLMELLKGVDNFISYLEKEIENIQKDSESNVE